MGASAGGFTVLGVLGASSRPRGRCGRLVSRHRPRRSRPSAVTASSATTPGRSSATGESAEIERRSRDRSPVWFAPSGSARRCWCSTATSTRSCRSGRAACWPSGSAPPAARSSCASVRRGPRLPATSPPDRRVRTNRRLPAPARALSDNVGRTTRALVPLLDGTAMTDWNPNDPDATKRLLRPLGVDVRPAGRARCGDGRCRDPSMPGTTTELVVPEDSEQAADLVIAEVEARLGIDRADPPIDDAVDAGDAARTDADRPRSRCGHHRVRPRRVAGSRPRRR